MVTKIKYGKVLAVIFLTVLIWVWADLRLADEFAVPSANISIAKSTNPNFWASFDNYQPSVVIKNIVLKGPASKIAEVKRQINDGSLSLEFFFVPEQEGMTTPKQHSLTVLDFLKKSDQIKQLGLSAESCDPNTLSINIVSLVKKTLAVVCVDESKNPLKAAAIEPAQVDVLVPQDFTGDAKILLTPTEIKQARASAILKTPFIELAPGQTREVSTNVKITMPPAEDLLADYLITTATLGITLSANLQGKYEVVLNNLDEVIRAIAIRATPDAKRAYEQMPYQVILETDDDDAKSTEPLRRQLIYNFPSEYDRREEIILNQQPVIARFKLNPLTPPAPALP